MNSQDQWPFPPIGLSRVQASIHLGIEPKEFERLVGAGEMPQHRRLGSREVWHRQELEIAFARLPTSAAPKEKVKASTAGNPNAYSPQSLAERWVCSERHIRNMVKRGDIPAIQFGGKLIRIRMVDVEAYEAGAAMPLLKQG